ncbi:LPS export ABC transporter periplasmic protein LptC [Reinekea sp.]|jgi:LPS export ABC transporter protein LptC|uniref:LPS export ABC transporter periplasmic protein LptC n=1 Tax=Reinekea sp. TaxID=1970455 RepID=UPI002A7F0EFF|nr:LPS export ABC transporter periplasmic protein LptC [Reinekea sp.]
MHYSKLLVWLLIGLAALLYNRSSSDRIDADTTSEIDIPTDLPDIYVTGMVLNRYDDQGIINMTVNADTLAQYNISDQSLLGRVVVVLSQQGQTTWQVTADEATILANDDIEFRHNVVAVQASNEPATVLRTDAMKVSDQGQRMTSDLAVNIVKGGQTVDAIGMDVKLDDLEPVIELLSEVTFVYEPS